MKISNRLKTIASLVTPNKKIVDIGCDHGLLDIYLSKYNNNTCIASDISANALNSAYINVKKYNVEDKVELVVSDGTKNININENYTLIMAGMGTTTIINILKESNLEYIDELIIQSNNDLESLRKQLTQLNYKMVDEIAVCEKDIYYIIIKLKKGKENYTKKEYKLGPILITKKDETTNSYFNYILKKNNEILEQINIQELKEKFEEENKWIIER